MVAPRHIFLDTSIVDGQQYNFSSHAFAALTEAAKMLPLTLVLPAPTEMEIRRHIKRRATEALKTLEDARRKAPFLEKWEKWPLRQEDPLLRDHLILLAEQDYNQFKQHFSVVELDYDGVDLRDIMDWYAQERAPFDPGKKRKEFPDAIALSSLLSHARKSGFHVAVVSSDKDFQSACAFHDELVDFGSIPALVDALVDEQGRIKKLIEAYGERLVDAIADRFPEIDFFPAEDPYGDVQDVEVESVLMEEVNALGLGDTEVECAFVAHVKYSAHLTFADPSSAYRDDEDGSVHALWQRVGTVQDSALVTGVATLALPPDWSEIEEVSELYFDTKNIDVKGYPPVKYDSF